VSGTAEPRAFVVEDDDWLDALVPPLRAELLETVRALDLGRLQRFPLAKTRGLPIGREGRVLARYLSGRCAAFEPSAFAGLYRRLAGRREREQLRAFVLGETLPDAVWRDLLGAAGLARWTAGRLLREEAGGRFLRFRVHGLGPLTLLTDGDRPPLARRVVAGTDTLVHVEFLERRALGSPARALDVGCGSGAVLLTAARRAGEALGLDLNPRAVALSRLNAELNGLTALNKVRCEEGDVFEHGGRFGRFDLVTWNMPFMLVPERFKDTNLDSYGGRLGVEIQARFLRLLPTLLSPRGQAVLLATTTILDSGEELLGAEIRSLAPAGNLDVDIHVRQTFWSPRFLDYQIECGVRHFESWFLVVRPGSGQVRRFERSAATRAVDGLRGVLHRARTASRRRALQAS
jgi:methylase of polypeptide subunit release factors